jgi:hypothetical protein
MHELILNGRRKAVAATWNELSRNELLQLVPVLYRHFTDPTQQKIELLAILFGINRLFALRFTAVQFCQILWMTDFLLGEHVELTEQLLPSVRPRWYRRKLYGPTSGLGNMRFLEFVFADSYFMAYNQDHDIQWLHKLLAVLYRPQRARYQPNAVNYGGDRRQDFNENLIDERVAEVAKLSPAEQLAILTWRLHAGPRDPGHRKSRRLGLRAARNEWGCFRQLRRNRPPAPAYRAGQDGR